MILHYWAIFSAQLAKVFIHFIWVWVVEILGSNYQVSVVRGCVRRCSNNQFVPQCTMLVFLWNREIYFALFGLLSIFGIKIKKILVKLQFSYECPSWNRKKSQLNKITQITFFTIFNVKPRLRGVRPRLHKNIQIHSPYVNQEGGIKYAHIIS